MVLISNILSLYTSIQICSPVLLRERSVKDTSTSQFIECTDVYVTFIMHRVFFLSQLKINKEKTCVCIKQCELFIVNSRVKNILSNHFDLLVVAFVLSLGKRVFFWKVSSMQWWIEATGMKKWESMTGFLIIVTTVFLNFGLMEINIVNRYCSKVGYTLVLSQCKLFLVVFPKEICNHSE